MKGGEGGWLRARTFVCVPISVSSVEWKSLQSTDRIEVYL